MYKKVLIMTDNLILSQRFNSIMVGLNLKAVKWSFALSPHSNLEEFEELLGQNCIVYNLKKEDHIDEIIRKNDLVFSLHCKQLFPVKLVTNLKCINIHPGYNPINRGWYPQVFAIVDNLPVGATIHEIDDLLDHGPIIARKFVEKSIVDTSESLYAKIIEAETELIEENIVAILENSYTTFSPENEGNLKLKRDFDKLCELDLDERVTTRELIDKLRALTHGNFRNAYFMDNITKKKVFIAIKLIEQ